MEDKTKQHTSYIDYMNDVFETTLPNSCVSDPSPGDRCGGSDTKTTFKEKWIKAKNSLDDIVIIRVNGVDFGINWKILSYLEPALESGDLAIREQMENGTKVYLVNRNVSSFLAVLDYHRNGTLHMPSDVCPNVFRRELDFWRLDFRQMSQCCLRKYASFKDNEETLIQFDEANSPKSRIPLAAGSHSRWETFRIHGWELLSNPSSSKWAKIYLGVASFFVILSIFLLAASTNPAFLRELNEDEWEQFMTAEELDRYYELVYKRKKQTDYWDSAPFDSSPGSAGDKRNESIGSTLPHSKIGKRSAPDEQNYNNVDRNRQFQHERSPFYDFGPARDVADVEDIPSIDIHGTDVGSDPIHDSENEAGDRQPMIRANIQDILSHVMATVKMNVERRKTMRDRQGYRGAESINKEQRSSRGTDKNINDKGDVEQEDYDSLKYRSYRRYLERHFPVGEPVEFAHRHKRSAKANGNQSETWGNSTTGNQTCNCVYMSRSDLIDILQETTIVNALNELELPTAYSVYDWAWYLEMMCIVFFAIEFVVRFIFAPSKRQYLLSFFTLIDFLALVIMLTTLLIDILNPKERYTTSAVDAINCFQVIRVFRFFRLMKDVIGFRVLVFSVRSSWRELILLLLYIIIAVTIFSTLIYYMEKENMESIPNASWWAIVTMTTVGYGDIVPKTLPGKLIGVTCALSGVLLIAVTVPVFVNNFLLFYEHSKVALYDKGNEKNKAPRNNLCSDSNSVTSDTTSVADSIDKESCSRMSVTREGSGSDLGTSRHRVKSVASVSKVGPILTNGKGRIVTDTTA